MPSDGPSNFFAEIPTKRLASSILMTGDEPRGQRTIEVKFHVPPSNYAKRIHLTFRADEVYMIYELSYWDLASHAEWSGYDTVRRKRP